VQIVLFGALGEVGTHLQQSLTNRGHQVVPVSSRPRGGAVSYAEALHLIAAGEVDLVVNAGGRGDRREVDRTGLEAAQALSEIEVPVAIPAILISTTRVLEGDRGVAKESDVGAATTEYAIANLENESAWLSLPAFSSRVLRLTNFFAEPVTEFSGQLFLLPWSLVTDAIVTGKVDVRSNSHVSREFVDSDSIAAAIEVMAVEIDKCPRRITTAPGMTMSLLELSDCIKKAFEINSMNPPNISFGHELNAPARVEAQWLESMGWTCTLTPEIVTQSISSFLVNHVK
jgi:nucleoside-diphosphate-sugar epimerase